jgi:hypothetical protein
MRSACRIAVTIVIAKFASSNRRAVESVASVAYALSRARTGKTAYRIGADSSVRIAVVCAHQAFIDVGARTILCRIIILIASIA